MHPDFHPRPMPSESGVFYGEIGESLLIGHALGAEGDVCAFLALLKDEHGRGFGLLVPADVGDAALDGGLPGFVLLGGTEEGLDAVDDLTDRDGGGLGGQLDDLNFDPEEDPLGTPRGVLGFVLDIKDFVNLASGGVGDAEGSLVGLLGAEGLADLIADLVFDLVDNGEVEDLFAHAHPEIVQVEISRMHEIGVFLHLGDGFGVALDLGLELLVLNRLHLDIAAQLTVLEGGKYPQEEDDHAQPTGYIHPGRFGLGGTVAGGDRRAFSRFGRGLNGRLGQKDGGRRRNRK
jgi:hypothetical protein